MGAGHVVTLTPRGGVVVLWLAYSYLLCRSANGICLTSSLGCAVAKVPAATSSRAVAAPRRCAVAAARAPSHRIHAHGRTRAVCAPRARGGCAPGAAHALPSALHPMGTAPSAPAVLHEAAAAHIAAMLQRAEGEVPKRALTPEAALRLMSAADALPAAGAAATPATATAGGAAAGGGGAGAAAPSPAARR